MDPWLAPWLLTRSRASDAVRELALFKLAYHSKIRGFVCGQRAPGLAPGALALPIISVVRRAG
jgi:hypothetical protein